MPNLYGTFSQLQVQSRCTWSKARSQNTVINYVIANYGKRKVHDVNVKFSRAPRDRAELWTAHKGVRELHFGAMLPGMRYVSMFAPGRAHVEPLEVEATYFNGPFFPRLGHHLLPRWFRRQYVANATLEMSEHLDFRPNVGYEGKAELEEIGEALKTLVRGGGLMVSAHIEKTTGNDDSWVTRIPTGTKDERGGDREARDTADSQDSDEK